jgi:hypothetical protein
LPGLVWVPAIETGPIGDGVDCDDGQLRQAFAIVEGAGGEQVVGVSAEAHAVELERAEGPAVDQGESGRRVNDPSHVAHHHRVVALAR